MNKDVRNLLNKAIDAEIDQVIRKKRYISEISPELSNYLQECLVCMESKNNIVICTTCKNHVCVDCYGFIKNKRCPTCRNELKQDVLGFLTIGSIELLIIDQYIKLHDYVVNEINKRNFPKNPYLFASDLSSERRARELVPLLFWINSDTRLSIPSVAIPFGQRFVRASLDAD